MIAYPGDPTATQAPSPPPTPGAVVVVNLPEDTDPPNGATYAQAFKVLADFVAWLFKPFARALAYAEVLMAFRNSNQQSGFVVDHQGFPRGRIMVKDENWTSGVTKNAIGDGPFVEGWNYRLFGPSGPTAVLNGAGQSLSAVPWGPLAQVACNGVHAAMSLLEASIPWIYMSETAVSISFDVSINGASAPDATTSYAIGLGDGTLLADVSCVPFNTGGGPSPVGVAVYVNGTTGASWEGYVFPPGGAAHATVLGPTLARDAPHRFQVDVLGTGGSDAGSARVIFIVDGAEVANLAFDMTTAKLFPFIRMVTGGVDVTALNVGPIQFRARLATGDTPI